MTTNTSTEEERGESNNMLNVKFVKVEFELKVDGEHIAGWQRSVPIMDDGQPDESGNTKPNDKISRKILYRMMMNDIEKKLMDSM